VRWIIERGARLLDGGTEPVAGLVVPTAEFFPDAYDHSPRAVSRLLRRIVRLAGLSDLDIRAMVVSFAEDEVLSGGGCSSAGCSVAASAPMTVKRVEERDNGYTVNIIANELLNPVVLTTAMVRAVSHIFLTEAALYQDVFERHDAEHGVDLCGVLLGFGVLLCNGAYIYKKG
jgi:hypothetical protein